MTRDRTVGAVTCSLALILAAACAAEVPARASLSVTSDSAGVQIVRGPATDSALPWRLVELRRFGGADSGALSFTRVSRYSVATDGRAAIAVLDHDNDNRIHVFDTTGAVLRSMGRTGGGPGETQFPNGMRMDATGAVSVFDESKSALVRWGPDGSPLPELPLKTARGRAWGAPRVAGDTMWVLLSFTDSLNTVRRLERWTSTDTLLIDSTYSPKPRMVMFKCVGLALPPLFTPELEWTVGAGRLATTSQSRYVVDLREGGRLTRSIRRDIVPVAANTTDAKRLYPEGLKVRFGGSGECVTPSAEVGEKVGVAATIPVVRTAVVAPDGTVWVERYTFEGETPVVDVFAREGQYLGTLTGRTLPLGFLDNDRVLFAMVNPDDDTTVIGMFRIER
ncbi:6-bladed beta-propeller [Gemmatimonas sp.]